MTNDHRHNQTIAALAVASRFSYEELEAAVVEYGAQFLDLFVEEASRTGIDLMSIIRALDVKPKFGDGK